MTVTVAEKKSTPRAATANATVVSVATDPAIPTNTPLVQLKASCACGGGCPNCQANEPGIQSRLTIGAPNDQYEQEADRVAEQVMRMPAPHIQRQPVEEEDEEMIQTKTLGTPTISQLQRQPLDEEEEEETIQTKLLANSFAPLVQRQAELEEEEDVMIQTRPDAHGGKAASNLHVSIGALRGGGQPLSTSSRTFFEPRFGERFNDVRVHTDQHGAELASSVHARAFTTGRDIVFAQGEYQPNTTGGRHLLAHELTHTLQQRDGIKKYIQKAEKINKADIRIFTPKTNISAAEVANMAAAKIKATGSFDLVISSGSKDANFRKVLRNIAIYIVNAFTESDFRSVLALDFSKVNWKKVGVTDKATITKFGSGLHAFDLIRWDKGKKLQLRMSYLKEITEIKKSDYKAKIKKGKTNFKTASFSFETPTAAQKKLGYKTWKTGDKDIVYMAVSRLPTAMLKHSSVKGIKFYRVKKAGPYAAQYDQSEHHVQVGDSAFQVQEGKKIFPLASPSDLYKQSSAISGDATSGFTSGVEYTIIHEIAHSLDWGPIRPELALLITIINNLNKHIAEIARIDALIKTTKDAALLAKLKAERKTADALRNKSLKARNTVLTTLASKTTLSGATFAAKGKTIAETNPARKTTFEKAIDKKTSSTIYAGKDSGEAFAEGLTLYIVNPDLLKSYRPDIHAYFLKLLPP